MRNILVAMIAVGLALGLSGTAAEASGITKSKSNIASNRVHAPSTGTPKQSRAVSTNATNKRTAAANRVAAGKQKFGGIAR